MSLAEIRARFGAGGIAEHAPAYGRVGAITDDTQMTLFTAEGCLRAVTRRETSGEWAPTVPQNAGQLHCLGSCPCSPRSAAYWSAPETPPHAMKPSTPAPPMLPSASGIAAAPKPASLCASSRACPC